MGLTVLIAATQGVAPARYRSQGPVGGGPDSAVLPASRSPPASAPLLEPEVLLEPELPLAADPVLPSEPSFDPELLAAPELVPPLDPEPPEPIVPRLTAPPEFEDEQASEKATVPRGSATRGRSRGRRR